MLGARQAHGPGIGQTRAHAPSGRQDPIDESIGSIIEVLGGVGRLVDRVPADVIEPPVRSPRTSRARSTSTIAPSTLTLGTSMPALADAADELTGWVRNFVEGLDSIERHLAQVTEALGQLGAGAPPGP